MYQSYRSVIPYSTNPSTKTSRDQVYQYNIRVEPDTNNIMKRTLIKELQTKNNNLIFGNSVPIFDGKDNILSAQLLPFDQSISITIRNPFPNNTHVSGYVDYFSVTLVKVNERDLSQIRSVFQIKGRGKKEYSIEELRSLRWLSKSENDLYAKSLAIYSELLRDKSVQIIRTIPFNPTVSGSDDGRFVFLKDYVLEYLDLKDIKQLNKGLTPMERKLILIHLKGERFRVPHQSNYGYYSFSGVTLEASSRCKFQIDGEDILVKEYFLLKYNYCIKLDFLPCIINENGNLFPMELCEIFVLDSTPKINRKVDTEQLYRSKSLTRSKSFTKNIKPNQAPSVDNTKDKILKNLNQKFDIPNFIKGQSPQFWAIFPVIESGSISKIITNKFISQLIRSYSNFNPKFRLDGKFVQTQSLKLNNTNIKDAVLKNYLTGCNNFKGYPTLLIFVYSDATKHFIGDIQAVIDLFIGVPTLFIQNYNTINPSVQYLSDLCKSLECKIKPMSVRISGLKLVYEYPRFKDTLVIGAYFTHDKICITSSRLSGLTDLQFSSFDRGSNFVQLIYNLLEKYSFIKHILLYRTDDGKKELEYVCEALDLSDLTKIKRSILTCIVINMGNDHNSNSFSLINKSDLYSIKHNYDIIFDDPGFTTDYYYEATKDISSISLDKSLPPHCYLSRLFCHHKDLLSYVDDLNV